MPTVRVPGTISKGGSKVVCMWPRRASDAGLEAMSRGARPGASPSVEASNLKGSEWNTTSAVRTSWERAWDRLLVDKVWKRRHGRVVLGGYSSIKTWCCWTRAVCVSSAASKMLARQAFRLVNRWRVMTRRPAFRSAGARWCNNCI